MRALYGQSLWKRQKFLPTYPDFNHRLLGPVMANLQPHLDYQESLTKRGIMFAAGPHWTDDEEYWGGHGMVVVRAASMSEAETIAKEDPMHMCGARRYRVRPWVVNEGTILVKLDYTTGCFELT